MERRYQTYRDRAAFFVVYIAEAHSTDGWQMPANLEDDFCIRQPTTFEERCAAARLVEARLGMTIPTLVDAMDNAASEPFAAWPERIAIVDTAGHIAYPGAPGPGGFNPAEAEVVLRRLLGEADPPFDPATLTPFTSGERYLGQYKTGLYPGGTNEIPQSMRRMQAGMARVLQRCLQLYPNVKIAYLTADGFRHFTGFEPHVWREAFGIKWLIESQIRGQPGTEYEGESRRRPWLRWGPYIWDNTWDQSYFTDGVHPAPKALAIFVENYWRQLSDDPVASPWLLAP